MTKEIVGTVKGAIANPISKKYLKKAAANQPLVAEESKISAMNQGAIHGLRGHELPEKRVKEKYGMYAHHYYDGIAHGKRERAERENPTNIMQRLVRKLKENTADPFNNWKEAINNKHGKDIKFKTGSYHAKYRINTVTMAHKDKKHIGSFNHTNRTSQIFEEVAGFADASAPSNSNYQTELSPTKTAKKMNKKKGIREYRDLQLVELAKVCPECDNTGLVRKFGNNILCPACNGDARVNNEKLMGIQAKQMLATGKTTPVEESAQGKPDGKYGKFVDQRVAHNKGHKFQKDCPDCVEAKRQGKNPETYRFNEDVISSLEDIYPILEAYRTSPKMMARVKVNVHPKLSKMLRDRLAARKPTSKGYKASQGTLGLAAARRAQMSHSKEKSPKGYPEEVKSLHHSEVNDENTAKKKPPIGEATGAERLSAMRADHSKRKSEAFKTKPVAPTGQPKPNTPDVKEGFYSSMKFKTGKKDVTNPFEGVGKKGYKPNYSARVKEKEIASLSAKPQMGSSNDNRMSEGVGKGGMSKAAHAADVEQSDREYLAQRQKRREAQRIPGMDREADRKAAPSRPGVPGLREPLSQWKKRQVKEETFLIDGKTNPELKKFTGGSSKSSLKRKYLGVSRGRTATGKPAHAIEVDPIIKTNPEVNKVVKS